MGSPLITTVIPTYRRPYFLKRAIKSVLEQTYRNFVVCIYDNASGDETETVVRELAQFDSRVKYYRHNTNLGSIANFEFGAERVETPFFSFLSDDDYVLPHFFEIALKGFQTFPEAMFSCTSTVHVNSSGTIIAEPLTVWREGLHSPYGGLLHMVHLSHPTWTGILFRREVLDVGLPFDRDSVVDVDFELRLAAKLPFVVEKARCAIFSYHDDSSSHNLDPEDILRSWHGLMRKILQNDSLPDSVKVHAVGVLKNKLALRMRSIVVQSIIQRDYQKALRTTEMLPSYMKSQPSRNLLQMGVSVCSTFPLFQSLLLQLVRLRRLCYRLPTVANEGSNIEP